MKKQLPDTPWHIGTPKMKESDHRRLNKWCIHYDSSFCTEPHSGCYMLKCNGSSHCKFYAESQKASEKLKRDNQTQEEIDSEHRRRYVESLLPKIQALVSSSDARRYNSVHALQKCYICDSDLLIHDRHHKQCSLCHTQYIDQVSPISVNKTYKGHLVYVMGQRKPKPQQTSPSKIGCPFRSLHGKCSNTSSPLFRKYCDGKYCTTRKKETMPVAQPQASEFAVIKYIPINQITVQGMAAPRQHKIKQAVELIQRNGKLAKPVYVTLSNGKYVLKDGYIRYLAAQQCGLTQIPVLVIK